MSSYTYPTSRSTTVTSLFPTGPAAPNAFYGFHRSPRDNYEMYAALTSGGNSNAANASTHSSNGGQHHANGGSSTLKRLMCRK